MKKKLILPLMIAPFLIGCGGGGGGGSDIADDNNILVFSKLPNYQYKGHLGLHIVKVDEAEKIRDKTFEKISDPTEKARHIFDCSVLCGINLGTIRNKDTGLPTFNLYQNEQNPFLPLDDLTKTQSHLEGYPSYTFLQKKDNNFVWKLNDGIKFTTLFAPLVFDVNDDGATSVKFSNINIKITFKGEIKNDQSQWIDTALSTIEYTDNKTEMCGTYSSIDGFEIEKKGGSYSPLLNQENKTINDIRRPRIVIESFSGQVEVFHKNSKYDGEDYYKRYLRDYK